MKDLSTTDKDVAKERGYELTPTLLPDMTTRNGKQVYYDNRIKWRLDDFARPGLANPDGILDRIGNIAQNLAKPLYFIAPGFHPLNVADNWLHAMGQDALKFRTYPKIAAEGLRAIRSVFTQNDGLQEEIRAAGGGTMFHSQMFDEGLIRDIATQAGLSIPHNMGVLEPFMRAAGIQDLGKTLHQGMRWSNKATWAANDMFYTSLYLRNRRMGMNPTDAVDATERWIGAYRTDRSTVAGNRTLQKLLNTPAIGWFSAYHQDLWHSYGNIIRGLTTESDDPQKRQEALGALFMSGILMFGVYPYLLDKGVQALTGNDQASFGRRGLSAIQDAAYKLSQGDLDMSRLLQDVWTPSIPVNLAVQGFGNRLWTGKNVLPPMDYSQPSSYPRAAGLVGDWALSQAIPPYSTAASAIQSGGGAGDVARKVAESTFGIKDPSQGAERFEENKEVRDQQEQTYERNHPRGVLGMLYNAATE
jgi:hypothetical protein